MERQVLESKIKEYMKDCGCSYQQAKIRVSIFGEMRKETEKARICPKCSQHTLDIQHTEKEYSNEQWVACENFDIDCDFVSEVTEKYEPLQNHYAFDELLYISIADFEDGEVDESDEKRKFFWSSFVEKSCDRLIRNEGWRIGINENAS